MANKKVSDKDYLFISSMLKARENRMLRRDRLEQMLSSGSFEEAARLLAEIGSLQETSLMETVCGSGR